MHAQAQSNSRPEPQHYTKDIEVSGQSCVAHLNVTRNGHFIVKAQMPDGSTWSVGNKGFTSEAKAVAAATRRAQRFARDQAA